jgi:hypothetical protein
VRAEKSGGRKSGLSSFVLSAGDKKHFVPESTSSKRFHVPTEELLLLKHCRHSPRKTISVRPLAVRRIPNGYFVLELTVATMPLPSRIVSI